MSEVFANAFSSTISDGGDGITAVQTTVELAEAPPAALSSGNWRLLVGTEIMLVTSVSAAVCTATRGAEGTTAAIASDGAAATHILTAGALEEFSQGSGGGAGYGAFASRPGSGSAAGELYICTDSPINYVWDGAAWRNIIPGLGVFDAMPSTGWTEGNMPAEFTATKEKGVLHIVSASKDADDWAWLYRSYTPPAVIEVAVVCMVASTNYATAGVGFSDASSPAKRVVLESPNNNPTSWRVSGWGSYSSYASQLKLLTAMGFFGPVLFRLEDDNTDIKFSASVDGGLTYPNEYTQARASYLTNDPGSWGIGLDDNSTSAENVSVTYLGYRVS